MAKNNNIDILAEKIADNEKLLWELSNLDSLDQIYDFCQTVQKGYTKDEFALHFANLLAELVDGSQGDSEVPLISNIEDDRLPNVSGGAKISVRRAIAAGLAALSFFPFSNINNIYAASGGSSSTVKSKKSENNPDTSGVWSKIKGALISIRNTINNHKKKIAVGTILLILWLMHRNNTGGINDKVNDFMSDRFDWYRDWQTNRMASARNKNKMSAVNKANYEAEKFIRDDSKDNLSQETKDMFRAYMASRSTDGSKSDNGSAENKDENKKDSQKQNDFWETFENIKNQNDNKGNDNKQNVEENINKSNMDGFASFLRGEKKHLQDEISSNGGTSWGNSLAAPLAMLFYLAGGGFSAIKKILEGIYSCTGVVSSIGKAISDVSNATYSYSNLSDMADEWIRNMIEEQNMHEYDRLESAKMLEEGFSLVKGQENAKKICRGFFNSVTLEKERLDSMGQSLSRARAIVFNGPSGTGKSLMAEILAASMGSAVYKISASAVDIGSSQSSIVSQIFGDAWSKDDNGRPRSLVKFMEENRGRGVVIINEYDKMYPKNGKNHPLDEAFRSLLDDAKPTINGKVVDASGIVFIFTTNETRGSLSGKVCADPSTGELIDPTTGDDNTGSRTMVMHDKSFLNRLTIADFDNLTAKEYFEIAKNAFAPTLDFFKSDQMGNVDITIEDESYMDIAKHVEKINEGARPIERVLGNLLSDVYSKITELQNEGSPSANIKLKAIYDIENDSFKISSYSGKKVKKTIHDRS